MLVWKLKFAQNVNLISHLKSSGKGILGLIVHYANNVSRTKPRNILDLIWIKLLLIVRLLNPKFVIKYITKIGIPQNIEKRQEREIVNIIINSKKLGCLKLINHANHVNLVILQKCDAKNCFVMKLRWVGLKDNHVPFVANWYPKDIILITPSLLKLYGYAAHIT